MFALAPWLGKSAGQDPVLEGHYNLLIDIIQLAWLEANGIVKGTGRGKSDNEKIAIEARMSWNGPMIRHYWTALGMSPFDMPQLGITAPPPAGSVFASSVDQTGYRNNGNELEWGAEPEW